MDFRSARAASAKENEDSQGFHTMDRPSVRVLNTTLCYSLKSFVRAQSLREIHEEGKTRSDIEGALELLPFVRRPYGVDYMLSTQLTTRSTRR